MMIVLSYNIKPLCDTSKRKSKALKLKVDGLTSFSNCTTDLPVISKLTKWTNLCSSVVSLAASAKTQLGCSLLASPVIIYPDIISHE